MKHFIIFLGIFVFAWQMTSGQSYQDYVWLTNCERQREEFVPPDSTNLVFEDCGSSDRFLFLQGPDRIEGKFHTNDFPFLGPPINPVIFIGCMTASGFHLMPPPSYIPPFWTVNIPNNCNSGDILIYAPPFSLDLGISSVFKNKAESNGIFLQEDSLFIQRVVFDSSYIRIQKSSKYLLELFGPQSWVPTDTFSYQQNGAFYVEGDVFVGGLVNGDLTLGASGNIFIDNDLKYECTDSTGLNFQSYFCDDKLGLVSEMNVFLETRHIATNKGFSWTNFDSTYAHNNHQEGVIINAGIIAYGESFGTFSANFPNFERFPNDPFGGINNPNYPFLGNHGQISHLGTLAQVRRGMVNSGVRGGFGGKLLGTGATGPQRVLIYDTRFATSPPQNFPVKITSIQEKTQIPSKFKLEQNYPNPFNPTTTINYEVEKTNYEKSRLVIFNILGKKVKEFELTELKGSIVWNGTNEIGKEVSSGVYFYRLETNTEFSKVKKMVFLK